MQYTMSTMEVELAQRAVVDTAHDDNMNLEQPTAFILKLFEMINGAPDEVIAWTPEGDAFVIGANLKTLESETLPRFFRHSRFQSFVRQLNFYSFRKINRERTMWVYKHDLFHRDRPEDLALLRRRTCPTIDGRRLSLSRPLSKKSTNSNSSNSSLAIDSSATKIRGSISAQNKKHQMTSLFSTRTNEPVAKHPSLIGGRSPTTVDNYYTNLFPLTESEDSDDQTAMFSTVESRKSEDQAMIVLKIASQLAQHVRDPKNGSRISGLVTPTYGSSRNGSISSGTLLTYDDDGEKMNCSYDHINDSRCNFAPTINDSNGQIRQGRSITKAFGKHSPLSKFAAVEIIERLVDALDVDTRLTMYTSAKIARFCMTTFPTCSEVNGCNPIRLLLASCQRLAAEFSSYLSALSPLTITKSEVSGYELHHSMWVHEESRLETVRSFSVFAVNGMQALLRAIQDDASSSQVENKNDITRLERTISIWQKYGNDTM